MNRAGALFALAAYVSWGVFPAYWKLLLSVGHLEILAHRIVWAAIFLALVAWLKIGLSLADIFRSARGQYRVLFTSAALIGVNWFTYIHAVNSDRVIEASLGYFINPLVNVFLGWALLREKLSKLQWASVALAGAGVLNLAVLGDHFPTISLILAGTFGLYGLIRKQMKLQPILGSTVESALLVPLALSYLLFVGNASGPSLGHSGTIWFWLVVGGAVTALPLLWFAEAAQRLPLSVLGFFQYIAPTIQFALGIYYGEPFSPARAGSFACIWVALAVFCFDLLYARRRSSIPLPQISAPKAP